jgi:hypothetical protein
MLPINLHSPACPPTYLAPLLLQTIFDIQDDWQPPTMRIQDTWRFIPIAGGWPSKHMRLLLRWGVGASRFIAGVLR